MQVSILSITTAALGLAASAQAVGQAKVINNCTFDVSVWSVGSDIAGPWRLTAGGGSYAETFVVDPKTGGKALKVTIPEDGLFTSAPQTDLAYSLSGSEVYYDLSDVFGDPFAGKNLVVSSTLSSCGVIHWPSGTPPAGSQVKTCSSANDVDFVICSA